MSQKLIGERIKEARNAKTMTKSELASRAGVSKGYLSQLEAGKQQNPSLDVVQKIAKALEMTLGELLGAPAVRAAPPQTPADVQPGLSEFLQERRRQGNPIPEEDVRLLMHVQWREDRPRDKAAWDHFYEYWKMWSKRNGT